MTGNLVLYDGPGKLFSFCPGCQKKYPATMDFQSAKENMLDKLCELNDYLFEFQVTALAQNLVIEIKKLYRMHWVISPVQWH